MLYLYVYVYLYLYVYVVFICVCIALNLSKNVLRNMLKKFDLHDIKNKAKVLLIYVKKL